MPQSTNPPPPQAKREEEKAPNQSAEEEILEKVKELKLNEGNTWYFNHLPKYFPQIAQLCESQSQHLKIARQVFEEIYELDGDSTWYGGIAKEALSKISPK